jgi:hypothetical protein
MALKEENFVMLHSGSWNTTAGMGVFDTNKPPSVVRRRKMQLAGFQSLIVFFARRIESKKAMEP